MNGIAYARRFVRLTFDREAVILAALFLVVLVPSVAITVFNPFQFEPATPPVEGMALGGAFVIAEVAFAAVLVGLILLLRRLPKWFRQWLLYSTAAVVAMFLGAVAFATDLFWMAAAMYAGFAFIVLALLEYDLWWIGNNLLALAVAIWVAPIAGRVFGVEALIVLLVGLSIYDWYFADRKTWMFSLGSALMKFYAPVIFLIPSGLRVDWDELVESFEDDDLPDGIEEAEPPPPPEERDVFGIGTADLLLPAAFASAVALSPSPLTIGGLPAAVLGVTVGVAVACFRLRWKVLEYEGGAGLPPLVAGSLAGYAPFALASWLVTLV